MDLHLGKIIFGIVLLMGKLENRQEYGKLMDSLKFFSPEIPSEIFPNESDMECLEYLDDLDWEPKIFFF